MDQPLLTIGEAATVLRVSTRTIRRMLKSKQLEGVMVRGQWRIYRASVEKYLKGGTP